MNKIIFSGLVSGSLCAVGSAWAQNPAAGQQADSWRFRETLQSATVSSNAAPELYSGETSDIGPQSVLELKHRRQYLRAFADAQLFYSDNIFLGDQTKKGSDVLVNTIQAALAPDAFDLFGGHFSPQIGYQHQWFFYGLLSGGKILTSDVHPLPPPPVNSSLDVFNFNVQTIYVDGTWRWHGWDFSLGVDYRRFLDSGNYEEFYREIAPRWAAHYTLVIDDNKSITVGYEGDYRFTRTQNPLPLNSDDYNDRTDHSLVLVGNWRLCPHAILQPFYRLQYTSYTHILADRTDWLNSFGIALHFPITPNIALRTFISYDTMTTDGFFAQDYEKLDVGGGLNLSVRF